jgi:hypothetical protein
MSDEQAVPEAQTEVTEPAATPETVATPAPETEAVQGEQTQAEKSFSQAELNEIIQKEKAKAEARAERRALKVYADKLEAMHKPTAPPQEVARNDGRPQISQFENIEDYVESVADWKQAQRDAQVMQNQHEQSKRLITEKSEQLYAEAEKMPGFDRESFDALPLTPIIAQVIMGSDTPVKLMAYLNANPQEVERVANLSPARQAAEIGKLEVRIASAPKISKAPEPITPIDGKSGGSTKTIFDANLSQEEFDKLRRAQRRR